MYDVLNFSDKIKEIDRAAIKHAAPYFERAENIAQANSARVMNAFWSEKAMKQTPLVPPQPGRHLT